MTVNNILSGEIDILEASLGAEGLVEFFSFFLIQSFFSIFFNHFSDDGGDEEGDEMVIENMEDIKKLLYLL